MQIQICLRVLAAHHIIICIIIIIQCPSVQWPRLSMSRRGGRRPGSMAQRPVWPEASLSSHWRPGHDIQPLYTTERCRALIGQLACSEASDWLMRSLYSPGDQVALNMTPPSCLTLCLLCYEMLLCSTALWSPLITHQSLVFCCSLFHFPWSNISNPFPYFPRRPARILIC